MKFNQKLTNIIKKNNSVLSIGLDPDKNKMPIDNIFEFVKFSSVNEIFFELYLDFYIF